MTLDTFTIKSKACVTLNASSGSNTVPLYTYTPFTKAGYRLVNEYVEVQNIKAISFIYSQPAVPFPVFDLEDSESQQLLTTINLEWKSERIQLDVVLQVDNSGVWQRINAYSLLNPSPYPYREYDLGEHTLGNNSMLGFRIKNVGYGLLSSGNGGSDSVTIYADLVRTVTVERVSDTSVKKDNVITSTPSLIVPVNVNRKGITFFNSSSSDVYIDTVSTVTVANNMVKLQPGDYWENPVVTYTGAYYAVLSSGTASIDIREFV